MATDEETLTAAAQRVLALLAARGLTLGVAESCTGGLVGHALTNVSGSSAHFWGGIIAYANDVKRDVVHVPEALLIAHGAVSRPVAIAMAEGVRRVLGVDVGLAVTGIAGPAGGTPDKPVGTVHIAVVGPWGEAAEHHVWDADRLANKVRSALAVLALLERELKRTEQSVTP
jgi:PncC family amidohydrolase